MLRNIVYLFLLVLPAGLAAQTISGKVVNRSNQPLPGASIVWLNSKKGVTAKEDGSFTMKKIVGSNKLVASHSGYVNDTFDITGADTVLVMLIEKTNLK